MFPEPAGLIAAFLIFLVVFRLLEWRRPKAERTPLLRKDLATDIGYWFFTPYVTKLMSNVALLLVVVPFSLIAYGMIDMDRVMGGFGPLSRLPLVVQAAVILVLGDFVGYWLHRAFHGGRLWPFHAIHHSSTHLDWLSALRMHPVNEMASRVAGTLPLLALGLAPIAVVGLMPFIAVFAIVLHADVDWDWGPLRKVIASPRFHRWHHTDEATARDRNFAGLFPIWDIMFGTYYMPDDTRPERFGTRTPIPKGIWRQLLYPFRTSNG